MNILGWILCSTIGLAVVVLLISIMKFRLAKIDMTFVEFARRLIVGGGYSTISPQELDKLRRDPQTNVQIVDLSVKKESLATPIPGSINQHFDDFLKDVVVEMKYKPNEPIVIACDTGHISRVASNILVEDEGFTNVFNLKGGIERWARWSRRTSSPYYCCRIKRLAAHRTSRH